MHKKFLKQYFILLFYLSFCVVPLINSAFCCFMIWKLGSVVFQLFFWWKVIVNLLVILFIEHYKKYQLYFYYNQSIRKLSLYTLFFVIDLVLYFLILVLVV